MVLVDTTVWIDFFGGAPRPHVAALEGFIEGKEDICICGVILAETLQGIGKDSDYRKTRDYFSRLIFLPMSEATFLRAAEIYRNLRRIGITIRKPVDCMIASVAIECNLPLLHNDRDFDRIALHSRLKTLKSFQAGDKITA